MKLSAPITWHDVVDSTNSEARRTLQSLANLSVVAAKCQTAGRGQGDHLWHSKDGVNLTFSVVFKFHHDLEYDACELRAESLLAKDALYITETVTLALRLYLQSHGVQACIKWPNDIYVDGLKICGILIENVLSGSYVDSSIVGIGLNINQTEFPSDLPNPVSLSLLTGREYDTREELEALARTIGKCLELTNTAEGRTLLDAAFREHMFRTE